MKKIIKLMIFSSILAVNIYANDVVQKNLVEIPKGSFIMGSKKGDADERPIHKVSIDEFYMTKYEITFEEWVTVYKWAVEHGYEFEEIAKEKRGAKGGQFRMRPVTRHVNTSPVTSVEWFDAALFCNALSEMEGRRPCYYLSEKKIMPYRKGRVYVFNTWVDWEADGYRLPTEAEWEYAARAGSDAMFFWGSRAADAADYANTADVTAVKKYTNWHGISRDDGHADTAPVGSFKPNAFGLYDMLGNVFEWVWDLYDKENFYAYDEVASAYEAPSRVERPGALFTRATLNRRDNPHGPFGGDKNEYIYRVLRGGAFWVDVSAPESKNHGTVTARNWHSPYENTPDFGFRVVTRYKERRDR